MSARGKKRATTRSVKAKLCADPLATPSKSGSQPAPASVAVEKFPLPNKYKALIAIFDALETAYRYFLVRKQTCTFKKLKKSVETICNRDFLLKHLRQIKHVSPEAYTFEVLDQNSTNIEENLVLEQTLSTPSTSSEPSSVPSGKGSYEGLIARRKADFCTHLLDIVHARHKEFLAKKGVTATLTTWHKDFPLEEIDDIAEDPLPIPELPSRNPSPSPSAPSSPPSSLLLADIHTKRRKTGDGDDDSVAGEGDQKMDDTPVHEDLVGVDFSIVAKVRKLSRARSGGDGGEELRRAIAIAALPRLAHLLRAFYSTEGKQVMMLEKVIDQLATTQSHTGNAAAPKPMIRSQVQLLCDIVPDWCCLEDVNGAPWLRVNFRQNFAAVCQKIQQLQKTPSQSQLPTSPSRSAAASLLSSLS